MANVGEIEYTVSVETQQSINAAQQFDKQMDQVQGSARKTDRELGKLDTGFSKLATAIKGVIAVSALRSMAGMVQQYQAMSERVQMATRSTEEFELVQKRLQTTADGTYRSLAEAQELYIRTADSIRDMGYSLEQTIDIQDSMSYAFVTNATSADRAQAAINQFTKAVNTGRVSADQWETISSAMPTIMNDIAAASGKSASEVRALGAAGKLTARDMTEGLRKSLDATRAAADNMATDLIDAGVRSRNALTTVLVGLENQTGVIQAVTNAIISASEAMQEFGQDAEKMESFLKLATVAGASLAAVMAGRMLTAIGSYAAEQAGAVRATMAKIAADKAAAGAALRRAVVEKDLALSALRAAHADFNAAKGSGAHALALDNLTAAKARYMTATTAATAAQNNANRAMTLGAMAAKGLRTAMAFLGGPVGVVMLAATAIYSFASASRKATTPTDDLTKSVGELNAAQRELAEFEATRHLEELGEKARILAGNLKIAEVRLAHSSKLSQSYAQRYTEDVLRMRVEQQKLNEEIGIYRKRLEDLQNYQAPTGDDTGEPPKPTTTPEGQKRLQAMRDEIELAKKVGVARARLAAAQRIGSEATVEERAEAEKLATELYKLEKAQSATKKATEDAAQKRLDAKQKSLDAAKSDKEVIAALNEQLYQTTLEADALRDRQAELKLSKYATPEQVEEVQALAKALEEAEKKAADLESRRSAFGADVAGAITGNTSPLSGGMFDDQAARYQAEADAEEKRYADALTRLQEAKDLELEVKGGYMALEEQMEQEHIARMEQIEDAKMQVMMKSAEQGFGAVADIMKTAFGEQSALYKAAFVAQKAAAIAQSIVAIQQGVAMAAANPWPTNLGAMASVAAATAGIVSTIAGTQIGSRRQGGPVSSGGMYRVNEGGAPEIFQNNLGQQFAIPNTRGEIISNKDASGSAGGGVVINIHNAPQGTNAESSEGPSGEQMIDIWIADFTSDGRTANVVQNKFGLSAQGR